LAQPSFRVVPNAYENLEGTSASQSPLGSSSSRIQYLVDSAQLCNSSALLTNLRLRLDGGNFNVDAPNPKTFTATIEAYEVPLTPRALTNDWSANVSGAVGTTVFQGALNVPAAFRQWPYPNPWVVDVPLQTPFIHQRINGNLLLDWNLTGGSGDSWPADGVFLRGDEARGETTRIWEDTNCASGQGDQLALDIPTSGNNGTIGLPLRVDFTGAPIPGGRIDFVYHNLGLSKDIFAGAALPLQLDAVIGSVNCQWNVSVIASQVSSGGSGTVGWPIPLNPSFVGTTLFVQSLGLVSASGSVVPSNNAWQIRVGNDQPPTDGPLQMLHRSNYTGQTTGFLSPTGYYGLVMGFAGGFL
jgi:hypothetical protein